MAGVNKFDSLREFMYPELPGCPPAIIDQAAFSASREFCDRSKAWSEEFTLNAVADQAEYNLVSKWQGIAAYAKNVRMNTEAGVTAGLDGILLDDDEFWLERSDSGSTVKLVLADHVIPSESVTSGITLTGILVPDAGPHTLPSWFLQTHHEAIIARAMSDLMTRSDEDAWYNPGRAAFYQRKWHRMLGGAMAETRNRGRLRPRGLLEGSDDDDELRVTTI